MFFMAGLVVKTVILILLFASVISWTIACVKFREVGKLSKQISTSLEQCLPIHYLHDLQKAPVTCSVSQKMINTPFSELDLSPTGMPSQGIKERVQMALMAIEKQQKKQLISQLGFLATVGSTAPFIGLFGTVWGIMNSFIGISESNTTDLAVVAPGIAEALFATALGLVAAIPAVMLYNVFSRKVAHVAGQLHELSAHINRLLSRELDLETLPKQSDPKNAI
nr:tonB-system energizer ExbB [Colwellia sp. E2M01]